MIYMYKQVPYIQLWRKKLNMRANIVMHEVSFSGSATTYTNAKYTGQLIFSLFIDEDSKD